MNAADVWDDTREDQLDKDTKIHLGQLFQDGFRSGVAEGQEEMVQSGFDRGYEEGMKEGIEWGTAVGFLKTMHALSIEPGDAKTIDKLKTAAEKMDMFSEQQAFAVIHNRLVDRLAMTHPPNQGTCGDTQKTFCSNCLPEGAMLPQHITVDKEIKETMNSVKEAIEKSGL